MLAKPLLALSSYTLLFALLAVRIEVSWIRSMCILLAALGSVGLALVIGLARRSEPTSHVVASVQAPGAEASGHLAGYLLPFVIPADPAGSDLVAYGIFLLVAVAVTAQTGAIQVNPLLYLVGWRVVQITDENGYAIQLVTRRQLIVGETIAVTRLSGDVAVERRCAAGQA